MKKLSLLLTLSLLALIGNSTLVKAEQFQNSNYSVISDDEIEIEGLEDVQPEVIEPITSEISDVYDVNDLDEMEFLEKIAEMSNEIE